MQPTTQRYDRVAIALHWLIGIGIILVGAVQILRSEVFAKGSYPREFLKALHEPAGMILFALILVRIVWRLTHPAPALPAGTSDVQRLAARFMHGALYAAMIAVPLVGMIATLGRGKPIDFGLFQLVSPFGDILGKQLAHWFKEAHEVLGQGILALAFVHAAAALWHHHVQKDDVLARMLPQR